MKATGYSSWPKGDAIVLRPKRVVRVDDIEGIIGPIKVDVEEVEEALGRDLP